MYARLAASFVAMSLLKVMRRIGSGHSQIPPTITEVHFGRTTAEVTWKNLVSFLFLLPALPAGHASMMQMNRLGFDKSGLPLESREKW